MPSIESKLDELSSLKDEDNKIIFNEQQFAELKKALLKVAGSGSELEFNLESLIFHVSNIVVNFVSYKELTKSGVSLAMIDELIVIEIKNSDPSEIQDVAFNSLQNLIRCRFKKSSALLAKMTNHADQIIATPSPHLKQGYTMLMYAIESEMEACALVLIGQAKEINHISTCGITAIYLALSKVNLKIIDALLERKELLINGQDFSTGIFDLVSSKDKKYLFDKCLQKLKETFDAEDYLWQSPILFPIALLTIHQKDILKAKLLEKIEELELSKEDASRLQNFIHSEKTMPFKRMDRLSIAFEALSYLMHPEWIKQNQSYLCGPACVIQKLAYDKPSDFLNVVIDLAEFNQTGKRKCLPQSITSIPLATIENVYSLSAFILETVKHNYNILIGYNNESSYSMFMGITTPFQIITMFQDFGFQVQEEDLDIALTNQSMVIKAADQLRKHALSYVFSPTNYLKLYSNHHISRTSKKDLFDHLIESTKTNPEEITTILISTSLLKKLLGFQNTKDKGLLKIIENSHYANIKNLNYNQSENKISFDLITFGFEKKITNFPAKSFRQGYCGLANIPPQLKKLSFYSP